MKLGTAQKGGVCLGSLMGFIAAIWIAISPNHGRFEGPTALMSFMFIPIIFVVLAAFGYALGWSIVAIAMAFGNHNKADQPIKQTVIPAIVLIGLALLISVLVSRLVHQ